MQSYYLLTILLSSKSVSEIENGVSRIGELVNKLQSRRPVMEGFLNQIFLQQHKSHGEEASETGKIDEEDGKSKALENVISDNGENVASQANVTSGNQGSSCHAKSKGKGKGKSKPRKCERGRTSSLCKLYSL